jgi:hypothetical protein
MTRSDDLPQPMTPSVIGTKDKTSDSQEKPSPVHPEEDQPENE